MMLYPAMKDLLEKVPSRYELVNVVACKARRIARDAEMAAKGTSTRIPGRSRSSSSWGTI